MSNLNQDQFQLFDPGPKDYSRSPEHGPWPHEAATYEHVQRIKAARGQQLDMVRPLRRIIDEVHKIDSPHHPDKGGEIWSPRDQWERDPEDEDGSEPLKERKLDQAVYSGGNTGSKDFVGAVERGETPPLPIYKDPFTGRETLADGHHRLAVHEDLGHEEIAISHRKERFWGESLRRYPS